MKDGRTWTDTGRDFTPSTLALVAGVSETYIREMIEKGKIIGQKIGKGLYHIPRFEGMSWIRDREIRHYQKNKAEIDGLEAKKKRLNNKRLQAIRTRSRITFLDKGEERLKAQLSELRATRKALKATL